MTPAKSSKSDTPQQVCILWHHPEDSPTSQLLKVLSNRGFAVSPASSMHQAFAGACSSAKSAHRVVLVLDDQSRLVGVERVLDGLERFAPEVICWEHKIGENPPMVPVVREGVAQTSVPAPISDSGSRMAQSSRSSVPTPNKLRLVGEETEPAPVAPQAQTPKISLPKRASGALSSSDVLDADELNALLAGEFGKGR